MEKKQIYWRNLFVSVNYCSGWLAESSGNSKIMDKTVVRTEAWFAFCIQEPKNEGIWHPKKTFQYIFLEIFSNNFIILIFIVRIQSNQWVGTIILSTCELIERPSKKNGFCFKLFHPMDQSIWAAKGPEGETLGAVVQPLPTSHLVDFILCWIWEMNYKVACFYLQIFRAPNDSAGKCWMDALELSLRCSSLLLRTMGSSTNGYVFDFSNAKYKNYDTDLKSARFFVFQSSEE